MAQFLYFVTQIAIQDIVIPYFNFIHLLYFCRYIEKYLKQTRIHVTSCIFIGKSIMTYVVKSFIITI